MRITVIIPSRNRSEQLLVTIRALRREADTGRLVSQARRASKATAQVRQDPTGLSFGFLRRLVGRLVAA